MIQCLGKGTLLFLRNIATKTITGPFESAGRPARDLVASLFGGRFRAQVRVKHAAGYQGAVGTLPVRDSAAFRRITLLKGARWIEPDVVEALVKELGDAARRQNSQGKDKPRQLTHQSRYK